MALLAELQRVVAETITDPAEIAAIDKLRKRLKKRCRGGQAEVGRPKMPSHPGEERKNDGILA
jgi:hypothetical protein